jgi:hypothetical protein
MVEYADPSMKSAFPSANLPAFLTLTCGRPFFGSKQQKLGQEHA